MILSVVIPSYNVEKHIEKTLESLINQTCRDFEVIVVDDGSSDKTSVIVRKILSNSWITNYKIIQKANGGVSSARNAGLRASSADYILFLDGDDYVSSCLVERIVGTCHSESPDVICWGFNTVNEEKLMVSNFFDRYTGFNEEISGIEALRRIIIEKSLWICTFSAAYKRHWLLIQNLRYTLGCVNGEDQEFTYKALSKAKSVVFMAEVLSYYVQRLGSISNSFNIKKFDMVNAMWRTGDNLKQQNHKELDEVITYISNEYIVINYKDIYSSCIYYLTSSNTFSTKESIGYLNLELDNKFPKMREEIKILMNSFNDKKIKSNLMVRLFKTWPILYLKLGGVKKRVKNVLEEWSSID